jgi:hypothetical protein
MTTRLPVPYNRTNDELHPVVYRSIIGLAIWLVTQGTVERCAAVQLRGDSWREGSIQLTLFEKACSSRDAS